MIPIFPNSAIVRGREFMVLAGGGLRALDLKVRYGFFEHPKHGPMLIDTGYTVRATAGADRSGFLKLYSGLLNPRLVADEGPVAFLAGRRIKPTDVAAIVVTHFHADHIAGLRDFPNAQLFAHGSAHPRVKQAHWFTNVRHGIFTELIPDDFDKRLVAVENLTERTLPLGLGQGADLLGDGSVLAVPLPGHADQHFGVVFPNLDTPLLYAVDVQWLRRAVIENRAPRLATKIVFDDGVAGAESVRKVAAFAAAGGAFMTCHDPDQAPYDHVAAK